MSYETLFSAINMSVLPAWFLLIFLPRFGLTKLIVHSGIYPLLLLSFGILLVEFISNCFQFRGLPTPTPPPPSAAAAAAAAN